MLSNVIEKLFQHEEIYLVTKVKISKLSHHFSIELWPFRLIIGPKTSQPNRIDLLET